MYEYGILYRHFRCQKSAVNSHPRIKKLGKREAER